MLDSNYFQHKGNGQQALRGKHREFKASALMAMNDLKHLGIVFLPAPPPPYSCQFPRRKFLCLERHTLLEIPFAPYL